VREKKGKAGGGDSTLIDPLEPVWWITGPCGTFIRRNDLEKEKCRGFLSIHIIQESGGKVGISPNPGNEMDVTPYGVANRRGRLPYRKGRGKRMEKSKTLIRKVQKTIN